ncbi:hypothetical protein CAPTEDRAFT_93558 [Capitella teleta]|uniref:Amine oxidase domain-containing protein n=1 Tax=Capitella teleta TaxID=283909 RepID=R7UK14_CAPTE|nr:hypothetical protein CAPTEDRAFT_93558 [Capitella teleta]|eukprot:ELU04138.1 hypothetical protein CAPTEDRAFT_93558 [Capitella teleta]
MVSVGIIGGGLAGLSAAAELRKQGFRDVTILEARDRTGGRIHTKQYEEKFIEMGAQYIHGQGSNPVYKIALTEQLLYDKHDEKTLPFEDPVNNHFHRSDGTRIDPDLVQETHVELEQILDAGEMESLLDAKDGVSSISVGGFVRELYSKKLKQSNLPEHIKHTKESLMFWRMQMERTESACNTMDELSMDAWREYDDPVGSDGIVFKKKGFQGILDFFLKQIPASSIKLNCPVESIAWDEVSVQQEEANVKVNANRVPRTAVTTTKGDTFFFDYVIVTCPLGVLKKHASTMFKPELPVVKTKAIENIGFGTVNKIFLAFDEPFWDKDCKSFQLVWHPEDDFHDLDLLVRQDTPWYQSLHSIDTVDGVSDLLIGWIPGRAAQQTEEIAEDILLDLCHELLVKFTGNAVIPRPSRLFRSHWSLDEYSLGSYSYIPKGFTAKLCDDLKEPLPSAKAPRLLFAGEATHANEYSTAQGALETGQTAAQIIVKHTDMFLNLER